MKYKQTQVSKMFIIILFCFVVIFLYTILFLEVNTAFFIAMFAIIVIISSFVTLKVSVNDKYLKIKFGYGLFRKKFLLSEIDNVEKVRNAWYHWWGIRVWFWPYMWIYNIEWYDAVEIKMKDWKIYRIWTVTPKELKNEILKKVK